ncbi:unnamed protein product [Cyprideis torosa]|uniref:PRKCA-binding protein n=1 Tax=Cyprideis torosa TaxID=163714 RepID=A0A7R8ZHD6_9CRUS|nr:unnamed protein product [Cyprideis torosa]CAG0882302.1 unnamed protein product [Cyprideis torosa]
MEGSFGSGSLFDDDFYLEEDSLGMKVTSGTVTLKKDEKNMIGISIGGGAPYCPCLYVVQVFDNTPASKDGTLQAGDEIIGINSQSIKGKSKSEAAKLIQSFKGEVSVAYNKLHADPKQGKTLDIVMKKYKHRLVERMSSGTADALGLSRAILCNDSLVKKLNHLQGTEEFHRHLVDYIKDFAKMIHDIAKVQRAFGETFATIGVREPNSRANEAFTAFANHHRQMEREGDSFLDKVRPIGRDMETYLFKAIPDTKLTIKKYADAKFEYLSYCLKVKELDDEEMSFAACKEPLYRVETGNYEYRLVLRCRQEARERFAKLRSDVMVKMELLDQKHVQHSTEQLQKLEAALYEYHSRCFDQMKGCKLFPIEVDCYTDTFAKGRRMVQELDEEAKEADEDDLEIVNQAQEIARTKEESGLRESTSNLLGQVDSDEALLDISCSLPEIQGLLEAEQSVFASVTDQDKFNASAEFTAKKEADLLLDLS